MNDSFPRSFGVWKDRSSNVQDWSKLILGCWELYYLAFFICHVIAMSSICYNPFLYGWMNTGSYYCCAFVCPYKNKKTFTSILHFLAFRSEFLKLCPCMKRKDQLRSEFFDVNLTLLCLNVRNKNLNGIQESNFLELQTLWGHLVSLIEWCQTTGVVLAPGRH